MNARNGWGTEACNPGVLSSAVIMRFDNSPCGHECDTSWTRLLGLAKQDILSGQSCQRIAEPALPSFESVAHSSSASQPSHKHCVRVQDGLQHYSTAPASLYVRPRLRDRRDDDCEGQLRDCERYAQIMLDSCQLPRKVLTTVWRAAEGQGGMRRKVLQSYLVADSAQCSALPDGASCSDSFPVGICANSGLPGTNLYTACCDAQITPSDPPSLGPGGLNCVSLEGLDPLQCPGSTPTPSCCCL